MLNEPISAELWKQLDIPNRYPAADPDEAEGSEPVPTEFLKDFYQQAYRRIRAQSEDVTIVFHDGFRLREWDGYFDQPEFQRIIVDTHLYLMFHTWTSGTEDLDGYLAYIRDEFATTLTEMSAHLPIVVGEWCLDTMSPKAAKLSKEERLDYYRTLATAQLQAWNNTQGWFYWNYKLLANGSDLDGWDMGKSIELGYLPDKLKP